MTKFIIEDCNHNFAVVEVSARRRVPEISMLPLNAVRMALTVYVVETKTFLKHRSYLTPEGCRAKVKLFDAVANELPQADIVMHGAVRVAVEHRDTGFYCGLPLDEVRESYADR